MSVLATNDLFPAGIAGISVRTILLRTGVRVRVAESGPANGTPLVMLHGWGASLYTFRHGFALLPERGVRVIAFDMRGYGLSDHPLARGSYSLDANIDDLDSLLDELRLEHVALAGHSMGGGVALHYAFRRPGRVARLTLINPVGVVPVRARWVMRLMPRWAVNRLGARAIPHWLVSLTLRHVAYGDASSLTQRDVDEYWVPTQVPGFAAAMRAGIEEFDWTAISDAMAASLSVPAVVFAGDRDRVIRHSAPGARRLRGARVVTVSGGHCVHEERPAEVYGLIGDFLGGQAA